MPPSEQAPDHPLEEAVADPVDGVDPPLVSAREAARQGMPGWPEPGEDFPPPTSPLLVGRGGEQIIPRPLNAVSGRAAPWAHLPDDLRHPTLADVRSALTAAGPAMRSERESMPGIDRAAAVLAPLYEHDGELHVVLTRRTWEMRSHSGEVSFPGVARTTPTLISGPPRFARRRRRSTWPRRQSSGSGSSITWRR